jgi:ABC-type dipeptide/oligopeptide/nickel transport system ATPase subunit
MDIEEVLKWADDLVLAKTGKHLNNLQQAILQGVWHHQKYGEIAKKYNCTESSVKKTASELWQFFSETLGENVSKSNFQATLDRLQVSNVSHFGKDFIQIGNVNFCADNLYSSQVKAPSKLESIFNQDKTQSCQGINLSEAPDIFPFHGRQNELIKLTNWILEEQCRVVGIVGMSGIGKTSLTLQLVQQIQNQFDCILWQNLDASPSLNELLTNLIQFFSHQEDSELPVNISEKLSRLMEEFRSQRCLLILDDVQMLLSVGKLAGEYKPEHEDYRLFFKQISKFSHNSCIILSSWELPIEIVESVGNNKPVRCLPLQGLGETAGELLKAEGLLDEAQWNSLINIYQGNPYWLKRVATTINTLFGGRVAQFLHYQTLGLSHDILATLDQQFNRFSLEEKEVISYIANEIKSVSIAQILANIKLSPSELFNAIQSLEQRLWIEKKEVRNEMRFTVQAVVREFVSRGDNGVLEAAKNHRNMN